MQNDIIEICDQQPKDVANVIVFAKYANKWLFCQHKERETWEVPGGNVECGEELIVAAKRELYEETGAATDDINLICYFFDNRYRKHFAVFFANIKEINALPESEMARITLLDEFTENTTYKETYDILLPYILKHLVK